MTGSERPSPEPLLKKEASPAVLGGENSGNALEASNALNYRAWGIPVVLSRGISSADRGERKGATSKNVQTCQTYFSTLFDISRAGQKKVKNRQKYFSTLFDNFRAVPNVQPLSGGSEFQETL